jgi:hypothetical protein
MKRGLPFQCSNCAAVEGSDTFDHTKNLCSKCSVVVDVVLEKRSAFIVELDVLRAQKIADVVEIEALKAENCALKAKLQQILAIVTNTSAAFTFGASVACDTNDRI